MNIFRKIIIVSAAAVYLISCASCSEKKAESISEISGNVYDGYEEIKFVSNPDEPEMGEYTVSENDIKLYYSPEEFAPELIAVLEKYFISFENEDYESYSKCVHEDYIEAMNEYLEADFGYDLSQSFQNQCDSLKEVADGSFKITRIKAEVPEEDGIESYLTMLDEAFGTSFYQNMKDDSDALYDMLFYVMTEDESGEEFLLLSEYEIVFAEKDGNYYTFG